MYTTTEKKFYVQRNLLRRCIGIKHPLSQTPNGHLKLVRCKSQKMPTASLPRKKMPKATFRQPYMCMNKTN